MNVQFNLVDLLLVGPAIIIFLVSLIPIMLKAFSSGKPPAAKVTVFYSFIGIIAALGLTLTNYGVNQYAFEKALIFDGLSMWSTILIIIASGFGVLYCWENPSTKSNHFSELIFLLLNSAVGMMIVSWANDLIVLFIGIEVMSLCLYMAISLSLEPIRSKESSFKYFVLGSLASAILLYGVAFVFGTAGTTYLMDIGEVAVELIGTNRLFLFGIILIIAGLSFKVAVFPFHSWNPDVYQGAPTPITGFMATGVKISIFVSLLRVVGLQLLSGERAVDLVQALEWLAVLSMVVGNVAAILQTNLKRMLAYSSVAHSGYIMLGIIASGFGESAQLGASGVMFYVFGYTFMTLGGFGIISLLEKSYENEVQVNDLKGLGSKSPFISFLLSVLMLSLAGLPPTVGFFGKFFIFSAALKQGLFWGAVWGVISSAISAYFYLRPIVYMYMEKGGEGEVGKNKISSYISVTLCGFSVIIFGIFSGSFYELIKSSVSSLF